MVPFTASAKRLMHCVCGVGPSTRGRRHGTSLVPYCPLRLGHKLPRTIILCGNDCAVDITNDTVKVNKPKAVDVRFH